MFVATINRLQFEGGGVNTRTCSVKHSNCQTQKSNKSWDIVPKVELSLKLQGKWEWGDNITTTKKRAMENHVPSPNSNHTLNDTQN